MKHESNIKGIRWCEKEKMWHAYIYWPGHSQLLNRFKTMKEAILCKRIAERQREIARRRDENGILWD